MATSTLIAAALFGYAAAQGCDVAGAIGTNYGPIRQGTQGADVVLDANHNPNSTSSVTFNFTTVGRNGRPSFTEQWTWRVNVSDIATSNFDNPNDITGGGYAGDLTDPTFTNVVYDFQWPGDDDLNTYLAEATDNATGVAGKLCYATLDLRDLPANVTNNYQESDNGSCNNVLGEDCVNALLAAWQPVRADGVCPSGPGFKTIPECASTLGATSCSGSFGARKWPSHFQQQMKQVLTWLVVLGNTTSAGQLNLTNPNATYPYHSGDGFWFTSSGLHAGDNDTTYEDYTHDLQAVLLQGASQKTLLCQRVNNTADTSGALGFTSPSLTVGSIALLVALASVL